MCSVDAKLYQLPLDTPFVRLNAAKSWSGLTEKERRYAHFMAKASFDGSLVTYVQTSPEAPAIFALFQRLFTAQSPSALAEVAKTTGIDDDDYQSLLVYVGGFHGNAGNYKGFGDTKIIPALAAEKLETLLKASKAWPEIAALWAEVQGPMYCLEPRRLRLGFGAAEKPGVTTYHSANICQADAELVDRFMAAEGMEAWNTRLFKTTTADGKTEFEIRLASIEVGEVTPAKEFEGVRIRVTRGDYAPILRRCVGHLAQAKANAANEEEEAMLAAYIEHFTTGDLNKHKEGSRHWIRDVGPVVESYIGLIENYRDPGGTRSEFEGFVAAVDKETSAKFGLLVSRAEELLKRLPWDAAYEKDKFLKPDFTSLDIIAMGGSGIPAGINIPNYDEIRQNEGFKNVSLGNVISATPRVKMNFLSPEDDAAYRNYFAKSFEVQVGLHELLGHGSGKLFIQAKDGSFNFDKAAVKDLESGEAVTSWYKEGETWSSKFGHLASAYEECRAEAVGYILCCDADVLEIFGFTGEEAAKVKYVNWMAEIRAGLLSLEYYSPESAKWGQAHCYARYVLTRVVLEAGQDFVSIKETVGEDGQPDLLFSLDAAKIDAVGKPATAAFLRKLQLFKSTGDERRGRELFERYGTPTAEALRWREICIARRQPRRIFVQPNTALMEGEVKLLEYDESAAGAVTAVIERHDIGVVEDLLTVAKADAHHYCV